jgi:hypothetical protein
MTLGGTVNGAVVLQLNSTGKTTLGGVVGGSAALSSITTNTGGTLVIQGGRVVTTGIQSYGEDVLLDNSLRSTSLETTDSAVTFAGTLKNNTANAEALTINAGTGAVTFTGAVGATGAGNAIGALVVNSAGDTTFTSTVDAASVTTNVGGRVVIKGGRITTSGAQSYGENAFFDNVSRTTVLNTTNSDVSFAGTLKNNTAAAEALTINAGSGAVTFTGAVGATGVNNAIGALEVNSTGDTTFTSTVDAASVTTNTGGRVFIQGGRISTTGAQSYGENVFLDNASRTTVLSTTDSAVTFAGTLKNNTSNAEALTITAGSGDVMFTGAVGTSAANGAIGALGITNTGNVTFTNTVDASSVSTATGSTLRIKGGRVTTTWAQWYGGDVLLDNALQSTTLTTTNSAVDFRGFVKNFAATPQSLTVNSGSGDVTFVGVAGVTGNALGDVVINSEGVTTIQSTVDAASLKTDVNGVDPVTLGGRIVIQGGRISTSGEQHYAELVKLDKTDVSVNATTVLNTVDSAVTFDTAIKNTTALAQNLTVNAGLGHVTFTGAVGTTGASGPLGDVVVNSQGLTTFVRTVDAASLKTDVDTVHIDVNAASNRVIIQGGRITTTGEQQFAELVVLDNASHATVLNAANSNVTFDKAIVNANATAQDLTINAGTGHVTFTGAVGEDANGVNGALGNLVINSAGETTFVSTVDAASLKTDVDTTNINVNAATNKVTIQGGRITTAGEQHYAELVALDNASHASVLNASNSPVTFDKAIVNANATAQDLTINAGTGHVTFTGAVGEDSNGTHGALGHLVINSAGETKFVSTVDAASVLTDVDTAHIDVNAATNKVTIQGGRITTTGEQHYAELVALDNASHATVLNTSNSPVAFDKAIVNASATAQDLTINAGTGDVTFTGVVGELINNGALGHLVINSEGETKFVSAVDAASLLTDVDTAHIDVNAATNKVTIQGGRVTTTGEQHYAELVVLGNSSHVTVLNTTNSAATFDKAIVNASVTAQDLTINVGTGNVTFTGAVGEDSNGAHGALGHLVINSAGETKFVRTVDAASLKTDVDTAHINVNAATNKVTLQGGRITTTGEQHYAELVALGNASHATVLNTTDSPVTFDQAIVNASVTAQDLTINAGTGYVTFTGAVGEDAVVASVKNGALGHLVINSAGETKFVSTVDAASLKTDVDTAHINVNAATNQVTIQGGRITTTGEQHFAELVVLGNGSHATVLNTTNSPVVFDKAIVNASSNLAQDLTINAGTGNVTFTGVVGDDAVMDLLKNGALGDLIINSAGETKFVSTVDVASLKTDVDTAHINVSAAANKVTIEGGRITTAGEQHLAELVVLGNGAHATVLNTTNSPVTFDKAIVNASTTAQDLTINTGAGHITFTGGVGEDAVVASVKNGALGHLILNSEGVTTFVSTVDAASLNTDVTGINASASGNKVVIQGGRITTTGEQHYAELLVLDNVNHGTELNTHNSNVTFDKAIVNAASNLAQDLTINTGTGHVTFTGVVGEDAVIASVKNGALGDLLINSEGITTFVSTVDAASLKTDVTAINASASGNKVIIQGGRITTTGDQHFAELVVLDKTDTSVDTITTLTSTAGKVTFDAPIHNALSTAPQSLTVNAADDVTFSGEVGEATSALGDVVVNTPAVTTFAKSVDAASLKTDVSGVVVATAGNKVVIQGGNITTTGEQHYAELVVLDKTDTSVDTITTLTSTAGKVTFDAPIHNALSTAPQSLTINGADDVTFSGEVGEATSALGDVVVNTPAVTTFAKSVDAASLKTDVSGVVVATAGNKVVIQGGSISTSGDQHLAELVVLDKTDTSVDTITTLTSTAGKVTFDAPIHNALSTAPQSLTVNAADDVTFSGEVGEATSALGDVVVNTPAVTTFAKSVDAASLKTDVSGVVVATAGNKVVIQGGSITTSGDQHFAELVVLDKTDTSVDTITTLTSTAGKVTFDAPIHNALSTAPQSLTINAADDVTFSGEVGEATSALGDVVVNTPAVTTFAKSVDAASLKTDVSGVVVATAGNKVVIQGGSISTSGDQHLAELVVLDKTDTSVDTITTLTSTAGKVTFDAPIHNALSAAPQSLTLNAADDVTFSGEVGQASSALGDVVVNTPAVTTFAKSVDAASLKTDVSGVVVATAGNKVVIQGGSITTSGEQHFAELVVLDNVHQSTVFTTSNSNVIFDAAIVNANSNLPQNLTINAGTGDVTFTGVVGEDDVVNTPASANTPAVIKNGALGNLIINSQGVTTFVSTVDAASLKTDVDTVNIDVSAATNKVIIQGGRITTTGEQHYAELVVLDNAQQLTVLNTTNSNVTFDKAIVNANSTMAQDLMINVGTGNVVFTGSVGDDDVVNIAAVGSTPAVIKKGALGNLVINSAGETKFVSTVDAASLMTDVDTASIDVNASTNKVTIQGGRITTTGEQHYAELVVLDNAQQLTVLNTANSNVTFDKAVVNADSTLPQDLTINAGTGDVTFTGVVGEDDVVNTPASGNTPAVIKNGALGHVTINSGGVTTFEQTVDAASVTTDAAGSVVMNGGRVTTLGAQSYADPIRLGPIQTLLKASTLSFNKISATDVAAKLSLISAEALALGTVELEGDLTVFTGAGGVTGSVSQVNGTWLDIKGSTNFVADTKANQVATLDQANHFGGSVSYLPIKVWDTTDASNLGSWASVQVQTNGTDLTLGQTIANSLAIQTQGGNIAQTGALNIAGVTDIKAGLNNLPGTPLGDINLQLASNSLNGPVTLVGVDTSVATAGNLVLQEARVNGNLNIDSGTNAITQIGTLTVAKDTTLNAGAITMANVANSLVGTVTINAATANIATANNLNLGPTRVSGVFTATSANANITQSAPLNIGGAVQLNAQGDVTLTQASNVFAQSFAVDARNATVVTSNPLALGTSVVLGNLNLNVAQGDLTQVGPIKIGGVTTLLTQKGNVTLTNADNLFDGVVDINTSGTLSLSTAGPLTLGKVTTVGDTVLIAKGKVDLGTSTFGAKINVNSGGFEIMQSGPIKFGGNSNFDAGSAKIDLFNPKNQWSGSILYKGGIVMINHPQLLNAVNAGTLVVRVETTTNVQSVRVVAPSASANNNAIGGNSTSTAQQVSTGGEGSAVTVAVARPASVGETGLITVAVSSEAAAPGRSFSFSLEAHVPAATSANVDVRVTQVDGKPLPEWLRYEPSTKSFVATSVPPGAFPLQLKVGIGGVETLMVINEKPPSK